MYKLVEGYKERREIDNCAYDDEFYDGFSVCHFNFTFIPLSLNLSGELRPELLLCYIHLIELDGSMQELFVNYFRESNMLTRTNSPMNRPIDSNM